MVRWDPVAPCDDEQTAVDAGEVLEPMLADDAIRLVRQRISESDTGYPGEDLAADRFEAGWVVRAPSASLLFLVGETGRIEQRSSSAEERTMLSRFAAQERALARPRPDRVAAGVPADEQIKAQLAEMANQVVHQLILSAPRNWTAMTAVFSCTVRAEVGTLWFDTAGGQYRMYPPEHILHSVRRLRQLSAAMSSGPWWRLVLETTPGRAPSVTYDYGFDPFPADQLQPPQNYQADIAVYPRPRVPLWLAAHLAGPHGRSVRQAAESAAADRTTGRLAGAVDFDPLDQIWARWAVLAALHVAAGSEWGPRVGSGMLWYESDRDGATLYRLPDGRAVLSGGLWDSPLLQAAYFDGRDLSGRYAGAPAWVSDVVLDRRCWVGLLSFCYWWSDGWWQGEIDMSGELEAALPAVQTDQMTIDGMARLTGIARTDACALLLAAAHGRGVSADLLVAALADYSNPDLDAGLDQLASAGLVA